MPEQELFARLSVFAGGCDARAAHRVCLPDTDEDTAVDLLARLVDRSLVVAQRAGHRTRYRVLETLRAYGRGRLGGDLDAVAGAHARHYTELAEEAALALRGPAEQAWVERVLPDYDNLRAAFERAFADRDADLVLRLATSMGELTNLRVGYESVTWAERALALAGPEHPLWPAAVGAAARGAWNRAEFARARTLVARAEGREPLPFTSRTSYPADVLADVQLYEGDVDPALAYWEHESARATDPIRLVWTLYYVAICHAVKRAPAAGVAAARESVRIAEETANPTALSMARYALGLVLKKTEPEASLALFEEAGQTGRRRAQLLVARHRADGGRRHPRRARRPRAGVRRVPRRPRPLGPRRRLDAAVAQPALHHPAAGPTRRRRRRARPAPLPPRGRETVAAARRRPDRRGGRPDVGRPTPWRGPGPRCASHVAESICNRSAIAGRDSPRRRAIARTTSRRTPQ